MVEEIIELGLFIFIVVIIASLLSFFCNRSELKSRRLLLEQYIEYKERFPQDKMPPGIEKLVLGKC